MDQALQSRARRILGLAVRVLCAEQIVLALGALLLSETFSTVSGLYI